MEEKEGGYPEEDDDDDDDKESDKEQEDDDSDYSDVTETKNEKHTLKTVLRSDKRKTKVDTAEKSDLA